MRCSSTQRRNSSCQSGNFGLIEPKGSSSPPPWRRHSSASRAFTEAISLCSSPSKLPAHACTTPCRRSIATSAAVSSPRRRRNGQCERLMLTSMRSPRERDESLAAWVSTPSALKPTATALVFRKLRRFILEKAIGLNRRQRRERRQKVSRQVATGRIAHRQRECRQSYE